MVWGGQYSTHSRTQTLCQSRDTNLQPIKEWNSMTQQDMDGGQKVRVRVTDCTIMHWTSSAYFRISFY